MAPAKRAAKATKARKRAPSNKAAAPPEVQTDAAEVATAPEFPPTEKREVRREDKRRAFEV